MRKLKLQMQISLDGFVSGPNGELDWMEWDWSEDIKKYVGELTKTVDTILMGNGMAPGFLNHWEGVVDKIIIDEASVEDKFAKIMVDTEKIIFSRSVKVTNGRNAVMNTGNLKEEVSFIKARKGGDIIVYGGAGFVTSLIEADLIDEYNLFYNPVFTGKGKSLFSNKTGYKRLNLLESRKFDCGIIAAKFIKK